jgi:hypothetical protein
MKKIIISAVVFLAFLLIMCDPEGNPVDSNTPVVDPITNTWTVESDSNYTFSFVTFDSTVTRGIFWGDEDHPTEGSSELCGFFDGVYVEFDVRRAPDERIKFKGKFINSNRMELGSSEGTIFITR